MIYIRIDLHIRLQDEWSSSHSIKQSK